MKDDKKSIKEKMKRITYRIKIMVKILKLLKCSLNYGKGSRIMVKVLKL